MGKISAFKRKKGCGANGTLSPENTTPSKTETISPQPSLLPQSVQSRCLSPPQIRVHPNQMGARWSCVFSSGVLQCRILICWLSHVLHNFPLPFYVFCSHYPLLFDYCYFGSDCNFSADEINLSLPTICVPGTTRQFFLLLCLLFLYC